MQRSLVCIVVRTARAPTRSPKRSVPKGAFHRASNSAEAVADALVYALERVGIAAMHPSVGFPMEMGDFPGRDPEFYFSANGSGPMYGRLSW